MTTATEIITPSTGIHRGVPFPVYQAWKAANQSAIKDQPTAAHIRHSLDHIDEPSDPFKFGQAMHFALFEPARFAEVVRFGPDESRASAKWKAWEAAQPADALLFKGEKRDEMNAMVEAARANPAARALIEAQGECEVSCLWRHKPTGVLCKNRMDGERFHAGLILDYKTCVSADPDKMARDCYDYGYDFQCAFQVDGVREITGELYSYVLLAQEKTPPYLCAAYTLFDATQGETSAQLEIGRAKYRPVLELIAECEKSGEWPGYPPRLVELIPPHWVLSKHEIDAVFGDRTAFQESRS